MNTHLVNARKQKNDEFYTPYTEVERIIPFFKNHFKNKIVYCNCDDEKSAFYEYFKNNFKKLQLKNIYVSGIHIKYVISYDGITETKIPINNGDYKSAELAPFIEKSDIIVTNPPFSLFIPYFDFIYSTGKRFLVIAFLLSMGYKSIYPYIIQQKVNAVIQKSIKFLNGKRLTVTWLTNLPIQRPAFLDTKKQYDESKYFKYDNYPDILNIDSVRNIPMDYTGIMGVPITFIFNWNPNQYKLIDTPVVRNAFVNGKNKFYRMFIQKL